MSGVYRLNRTANSVGRINTRRVDVSAFSPTDIAGLQLWLDFSDASTLFTDAGTTPVSSDGDAIYQANDKSGNGYHVAQADSTYRPLYKTNIIGGNSTSLFDGSNDYLMNTEFSVTLDKLTIFAITRRLSTVNNKGIFTMATSIGKDFEGTNGFVHAQTSGNYIITRSLRTLSVSGFNTNNNYLSCCIVDTDIYKMRRNGQEVGTISHSITTEMMLSRYICGARMEPNPFNFNNIHLGEILLYNGAISADNITVVESYLNTKWAIY